MKKYDTTDGEDEMLRGAFALFDLDGNKHLDKAEIENMKRFLTETGDKMSEEEIKQLDIMIASADKNGDGVLDYGGTFTITFYLA